MLLCNSLTMIFVLVLIILKFKKRLSLACHAQLPYFLGQALITALYFRNLLPRYFLTGDKSEFDESILTNFLIVIAMPINEFWTTLLLVPVYIATSYVQVLA